MFQTSLAALTGNAAAEAVLLHLYHHGETYGRAVAGDLGLSEYAVRKQLQKLELAGLLISSEKGRTRIFTWNPKNPVASKLRDLVEVVYESLPLKKRQEVFSVRRRPRAKGKPVVGR